MSFEVVGDIMEVETFAVGSAIRELPRCAVPTAQAVGGSARGSPEYASKTARPISPRSIGTRPTASAASR